MSHDRAIIQFGKPAIAGRSTDFIAGYMDAVRDTAERKSKPPVIRATTVTARNQQTRKERRQAWNKARAATDYWHALLKFYDAISIATREGLREACSAEKAFGHESRGHALDSWRGALCRQMFTAAPDIAAVNWKRIRSNQEQALFAGAKRERMERVIADDVAFLKSHHAQGPRSVERELIINGAGRALARPASSVPSARRRGALNYRPLPQESVCVRRLKSLPQVPGNGARVAYMP